MRMKAGVTGFPALRKRFVDVVPANVRAAVAEPMLNGAARIVQQARSTVPRDSGELASSIDHTDEVREDKRGRLVVFVWAGNDKTKLQAPGGTFQLARIVEFGTSRRQAEPFFYPAVRANQRAIRGAIRRAIKKAVAAS